jgi:uncharacterized protein (DUF1778 family)
MHLGWCRINAMKEPHHHVIRVEPASMQMVQQRQVISLSLSESRRFAEALLNPPEPSDYVQEAFKRYRRLVSQNTCP